MVFFSAPKARHQEILGTIAKIEEKSKQTSQPRVIELKNATPSQVAEAIEKAYDTRRTGGQGSAPKTPRFTVTGHDPSRRIFVVADDDMFTQISSLIANLDVPVPGGGIMGEFRIYPLQYANAKAVHGQMTKLVTEYIQRLGPKAKDMEAFSVQPDETANALVVLGTPSVFGFIEDNLRKIDTPASKATQPEVHVVELKNADPDAVTRALTEIFVRNAPKSADGDSPISISAAAASKAILVRANAVDFARIMAAIKELDTEDIATSGEVRVVTVQFGDASEIKTALESYLQKPSVAGGARSGQLVGDVRLAVMAQTNTIMISGDKDTLDRLEGIARGMDIAGEKGSVPQIIPLKFASASLVLPALKEMFSDTKFGGGRKGYTPPIIVADEAANALIVRAAPQELASIQGIVTQLDTEDKVDKSGPRIVQVAVGVNVEDLAEQVAESINETAKARLGNTKGAHIPSIIAIPNLRTNTITLAGNSMLYDEAEAMIKALEKMGPAGGKSTVVIGPKNIATEDLQRLIDQLTQKQSSGGRRGSSSGSAPRPQRGNNR
jgi:type II secretory pathway component GspD/PulD (secretin)